MADINENISNGQGIARFLRDHGAKYVFGIPDGLTLGLYEGIKATDGIDHILLNDERSAAFAADAYARITGTLGVCDAGAVGSMNFPIGLVEAKGSGSPVLALVGIIKAKKLLRNFPHDINVAETLSPLIKWTGKILVSENLPRFMKYAIKQAINGRPGPVALVISENVLSSSNLKAKAFTSQTIDAYSVNSQRIVPNEPEIDQILKRIRNAKQPAIFAGGGAVLSGAYEEIAELARILKAPVFSTISGKGIMVSKENPEDNLYFGIIGLFGEKPNHRFIKTKVDLLLAVGNRLTEDDTAFFKYPSQRINMIQIDVDTAEIGLSYNPMGVVGDPKATLTEIIKKLKSQEISLLKDEKEILDNRIKNIRTLGEKYRHYRKKDMVKWLDVEPIKPQRVLKAISDNMSKDDYLVTDASASSRWIGAYFPVKSTGRKIITPRGVGPTGFGVGALIGTCIAADSVSTGDVKPKKILFTGDGGLMNGGINEFETIKKLGLDCTIVVINNYSLGYIKFAQSFIFNRQFYEVDRPNTDFSRIVEAYGGKGIRVEKLEDLDSAIHEAIMSKGFSLVDVIVDPEEFLPPSYYYHEWDFF